MKRQKKKKVPYNNEQRLKPKFIIEKTLTNRAHRRIEKIC